MSVVAVLSSFKRHLACTWSTVLCCTQTSSPAMTRAQSAGPTEISPLLSKPDQDAHPIDPSNGLVPEGADGSVYRDEAADDDGGDIERQASHGEASKHQGMPEVKKRMKFIFPAIAIGVCT